jgi:alkylation response protein AidB-like acyl-CoA dehydrogenase
MPTDLDAFANEAREFLDANAARRAAPADQVEWGSGEDRITYFGDDPPDVAAAKVAAARDWQRTRYDHGFGWITGPPRYGGRGLTSVHDLVYDGLEAGYDVPDTGVLSLIGLGKIGPTILQHGQQAVKDRYLPALYRGEVIACQLFSEPAAGSPGWSSPTLPPCPSARPAPRPPWWSGYSTWR